MEALAIIDVHAHCVKTEVIGLLGGIYCQQTQQLFILTAEPCASLDDHDLQCDMEPGLYPSYLKHDFYNYFGSDLFDNFFFLNQFLKQSLRSVWRTSTTWWWAGITRIRLSFLIHRLEISKLSLTFSNCSVKRAANHSLL